jgi:hypothetical protein
LKNLFLGADMKLDFEDINLVVNRFLIKKLNDSDRSVYEYACKFKEDPDKEEIQRNLFRVCYSVKIPATILGFRVITKDEISPEYLKNENWQLSLVSKKVLDCQKLTELKTLERLEQNKLERELRKWKSASVEKSGGVLVWWVDRDQGREKHGEGWEVHRGRKIDIYIDSDDHLYLEIDVHHRFYTPWTLHQWQDKYPDIACTYVRNTYRDKNNRYINWRYERVSEQLPNEIMLDGLDKSLAEYHLDIGATEEEVNSSRVVYVSRANQWGSRRPSSAHLSKRLSPSLTMDMLAAISDRANETERKNIQEVFSLVKKTIDSRLKESGETAQKIIKGIYRIDEIPTPLMIEGKILPKGKLLALNGEIAKVAQVRFKGCIKAGDTNFGCLNLFNDSPKYPEEVANFLLEVAKNSNIDINIDSYRTAAQLPNDSLDRQMFWQNWSNEEVKTVLVVMPWSSSESKQQIRVDALKAGIATQFIVPKPKASSHKAANVALGLLCKAGWQPVRLEPIDHPEAPELIIGFDTGTNRELYYGTSAFAVLADGQSLGWELPDIQRGERFSGSGIWQTVSKLVIKFYGISNRYPRKVLLMRDGLVQAGEFDQTIEELNKKKIASDVLSVRKSGSSRMGYKLIQDDKSGYRDAEIGSVIFAHQEKSFLLVTSKPVSSTLGSARPLTIIHEHGNTQLELLALQTYHLTQLHPASGFSASRLPWVLHLADKSSKEFQRIGQISILQNLNREKLIAV